MEPIEHGEQLDISHIVLMTRAVCLVVIGDENVAQQVPNPEVDTSRTITTGQLITLIRKTGLDISPVGCLLDYLGEPLWVGRIRSNLQSNPAKSPRLSGHLLVFSLASQRLKPLLRILIIGVQFERFFVVLNR